MKRVALSIACASTVGLCAVSVEMSNVEPNDKPQLVHTDLRRNNLISTPVLVISEMNSARIKARKAGK